MFGHFARGLMGIPRQRDPWYEVPLRFRLCGVSFSARRNAVDLYWGSNLPELGDELL